MIKLGENPNIRKKQMQLFSILVIVALLFLTASLIVNFTLNRTLFREETTLNEGGIELNKVYTGEELNCEAEGTYAFDFEVENMYLQIEIFDQYGSSDLYYVERSDIPSNSYFEHVGKIFFIVLSSPYFDIAFSFEIVKIRSNINWIYGIFAFVYGIFFMNMLKRIRKNERKETSDFKHTWSI